MGHCNKRCLSVFLTDACNLSCRYCYCKPSAEKENAMITFDFVKAAIDDFFSTEKRLYIRFFGNGEPTLCLDLIKEIVAYCKLLTEDTTFELQTNGYFSDDICNWIGENIDIIWVSYDGTSEANAYYRILPDGGSANQIVEKNIVKLTQSEKVFGVRSTIGRKNIHTQINMIDNMERLNVKYLFSDIMFASVEDGMLYEESISPMEYAKYFLEARKYANTKNIYYGSFFTINFDEKVSIFCRSCLPMPHLTVDGYVSCCDMGYSCDNEALIYGQYSSSENKITYDAEKISYIQKRSADNIPQCQECKAKYHCAGGCIGEALVSTGSIYGIKKENCQAIRFLFDELRDEKIEIPIFHP